VGFVAEAETVNIISDSTDFTLSLPAWIRGAS